MEYCPNGELHQHLRRVRSKVLHFHFFPTLFIVLSWQLGSFDFDCTLFYIAELVSALEYLHAQGIVLAVIAQLICAQFLILSLLV